MRLNIPPITEWDHSNGHRYVMSRSYPSAGRMLLLMAGDAAVIFFMPVMAYAGAALVSAVRKRPFVMSWLLWTLWIISILGWVLLEAWDETD